jgi:hypothetical protein
MADAVKRPYTRHTVNGKEVRTDGPAGGGPRERLGLTFLAGLTSTFSPATHFLALFPAPPPSPDVRNRRPVHGAEVHLLRRVWLRLLGPGQHDRQARFHLSPAERARAERRVPSSLFCRHRAAPGPHSALPRARACVFTPRRKVAIKKIKSTFRDLTDAKRILRELKLCVCLRGERAWSRRASPSCVCARACRASSSRWEPS